MGLIKFIKTWTLPLSITFGAVIYLIFCLHSLLVECGNAVCAFL